MPMVVLFSLRERTVLERGWPGVVVPGRKAATVIGKERATGTSRPASREDTNPSSIQIMVHLLVSTMYRLFVALGSSP